MFADCSVVDVQAYFDVRSPFEIEGRRSKDCNLEALVRSRYDVALILPTSKQRSVQG